MSERELRVFLLFFARAEMSYERSVRIDGQMTRVAVLDTCDKVRTLSSILFVVYAL